MLPGALQVRPGYSKTTSFAFLDVTPFVRNAMSAVVEDSFTKCFESKEKVRWDNTFYLLPLSYAGALIRCDGIPRPPSIRPSPATPTPPSDCLLVL